MRTPKPLPVKALYRACDVRQFDFTSTEELDDISAVSGQTRAMGALHGTNVPVPKQYLLCDDDSVIGQMFYVMDFTEGRVMADPYLPNMTNDERGALYEDFARVLANLHAINREED